MNEHGQTLVRAYHCCVRLNTNYVNDVMLSVILTCTYEFTCEHLLFLAGDTVLNRCYVPLLDLL